MRQPRRRVVGFGPWRLVLATLLLLPLAALTGCATRLPSAPEAAPVEVPLPVVSAEVWNSRGHVLRREPFVDPPLADRGAVLGAAWRAVYTSVSGLDGGGREVSGAFFVPRGIPPRDGWPVVSLAHETTGIGHDCGPSRQPNLMEYAPLVQSLLTAGYAVALSDYEGLGESGSHPYLEPRTVAFNTIDAVRALRELSPDASPRWVALGFSQGGQAVWAANELNTYYGDGLQLLGSVALAPPANITGLADLVTTGSMTANQRARFPLVITGLARYNPDLDAHAFLHESTAAYRNQFSRCETTRGRSNERRSAPVPWGPVVDRLSEANDVKPATARDGAALADALRRVALPQRPLDRPMLVINGTEDAVVLPDWIQYAVAGSCALGGRIEYLQIPGVNHERLIAKATQPVGRWIADRFAGLPAPSNCPAGQN